MKLTSTTIRRMLRLNCLTRIEMIMSDRGFTAVAYPANYSPLVEQRRIALLQKMHDDGITSIALMSPESDRLHDAMLAAIAHGTADEPEQALDALARALAHVLKDAP